MHVYMYSDFLFRYKGTEPIRPFGWMRIKPPGNVNCLICAPWPNIMLTFLKRRSSVPEFHSYLWVATKCSLLSRKVGSNGTAHGPHVITSILEYGPTHSTTGATRLIVYIKIRVQSILFSFIIFIFLRKEINN